MKFFHLSDLHLGKRVNEFSMMDDQRYILMEIVRLAKENKPDAILIAGDIYDKSVPPVAKLPQNDRNAHPPPYCSTITGLGVCKGV